MIKIDWFGSGPWVGYYSRGQDNSGDYVLEWLFLGIDGGPPDPMTHTQLAVLDQTIALLTQLRSEL